MICTFRMYLLPKIVLEQVLENVCPLTVVADSRKDLYAHRVLEKYPVSERLFFKPVDPENLKLFLENTRI